MLRVWEFYKEAACRSRIPAYELRLNRSCGRPPSEPQIRSVLWGVVRIWLERCEGWGCGKRIMCSIIVPRPGARECVRWEMEDRRLRSHK